MSEILSIYGQTEILSGIYKINFPNGKTYIGQSNDIIRRMREHNSEKRNYPICKAIEKYGQIKEFELLERISPDDLDLMNEREMYYIQLYNSTVKDNGYNITLGGDGTRRDYNDPTILKIKEDLKNGIGTEKQIAEKFGVDVSVITRINTGKHYYNSKDSYPLRKTKYFDSQILSKEQIDEIIKLLKEDYQTPMYIIAQNYNVSEKTVERINQGHTPYHKNDVLYPIRKIGENHKMFSQDQVEKIIDELKNTNKSQIEIAKEYGCDRSIIGKINSGKKYFQETETYPIRMTDKRKKMIKNEKQLGENGGMKIKVISSDGEEYIFNSYAEMERIIGLNRNTAKRSLELNIKIVQGKYKDWKVEAFIEE